MRIKKERFRFVRRECLQIASSPLRPRSRRETLFNQCIVANGKYATSYNVCFSDSHLCGNDKTRTFSNFKHSRKANGLETMYDIIEMKRCRRSRPLPGFSRKNWRQGQSKWMNLKSRPVARRSWQTHGNTLIIARPDVRARSNFDRRFAAFVPQNCGRR